MGSTSVLRSGRGDTQTAFYIDSSMAERVFGRAKAWWTRLKPRWGLLVSLTSDRPGNAKRGTYTDLTVSPPRGVVYLSFIWEFGWAIVHREATVVRKARIDSAKSTDKLREGNSKNVPHEE